MPVLRRQIELSNSNEETLQDNEEIFYCESTKEIFRNYDDYFKRIMLINSMVWTCELTGRVDLTYNEALQSEKSSRKLLKDFPLKIPALLLANQLKCTSWKDLLEEVWNYLKQRFCIGDKVALIASKKKKIKYFKVVNIFNDKPDEDDPDAYRYKLESEPPSAAGTYEIISGNQLYRTITSFNRERLKMFLRQFIYQKDNVLQIKEDLFKKYVDEDPSKLWRKHFPNKLPVFESSKRYDMIQDRLNTKKVKKEKKKSSGEGKSNTMKKNVNGETKTNSHNGKQTSISKYLTKTSNDNKQSGKEASKSKEDGPSMLEKMRIREEERKKKIEQEKERQKNIVAMTTKIVRELNQTNQDDLQLRDVRPIPSFKPVTTILPMEYFGDFVVILEFMHSFSDLLTMKDKFQDGMTMDILERALLLRESNGPLNDILQVLLSSIFWLQLEEEEYCDIQYVVSDKNIKIQPISENEKLTYYAARAAKHTNKYYGSKLTELPMDTFTINELIRLHLLSSGAIVSSTTARWRFQNRGGYQSIDDPGFEFCKKYPHIVKFLEKSTVFQLPVDDLLKIILCLINQIQTYSSVRTEIEERLEQSTTAKINLKNFYTKQRRLKADMVVHKSDLQAENTKKLEELFSQETEPPDMKIILEEFDFKIEKGMKKFEKPLKELEKDFAKYKQDLFAFQMLLGSDRAYRNYWMFESLPGIFIEHCTPSGKCLETKPDYLPGLAECSDHKQRYKFIKNYVTEKFFNDKELNKENINDASIAANLTDPVSSTNGINDTESLFMCTTNEADCPVHTVDHPSYRQWSYINTEEELTKLINSLNSLGIRERPLKECLELQKNLILDHIANCPVEKLSVDLSQKDVIIDKMIKNMKRYATNGATDDPNLILELATRENIFDLFDKVITGHLGQIHIKNRLKWGENLMLGNYDEMGFKKLRLEITNSREYRDPGEHINDLIVALDDESISQYSSNNNNDENVKKLALALLQIQKGIDKKFLKPPFGGKDNFSCDRQILNWQTGLVCSRNYSQVLLHYNVMYDAIKWSKSIERAYCRTCRRQKEPEKMLLCDDCNAGYHMHCLKPKLKSIPVGDWFCVKCKPKSEKKQNKTAKFSEEGDEEEFDESINDTTLIDEEDETFHINNDSDEEDDSAGDKSSSDEATDEEEIEEEVEETKKTCKLCNTNFDDDDEFQLVECENCPLVCHIECAIPPLKHKPRHWICWRCNKKLNKKKEKKTKKKNKKKRKHENSANGEAILNKKPARGHKSPIVDDEIAQEKQLKSRKRKVINGESEDDETPKRRIRPSMDFEQQNGQQSNNANRRSRQNDLPLHIVVLHGLLEEISRHEDSWPFNRPVSKVDVPDYYEIIKIPMDFAKIKSRLNVGHYASDYDIMSDMQQVFINCDLYNNSASDIYKAGIRLEKFVQSKCKELKLPFRPSDMIIDEFEPDDELPLKRIAVQVKEELEQSSDVLKNGD